MNRPKITKQTLKELRGKLLAEESQKTNVSSSNDQNNTANTNRKVEETFKDNESTNLLEQEEEMDV